MVELIAIAAGAVLLLVLMNFASRQTSGLDQAYFRKKWQEIMTLSHTSAAAARLAVIEADKLLDRALKDKGFRGETMGDRLKAAGKALGNQNAVWSAHKLRNQLAHEDRIPKRAEIKTALKAFEKCLKNLGAL